MAFKSKVKRLTLSQWRAMVKSRGFKDISSELPGGFMLTYQWMRAKIVVGNLTYYASGWCTPDGKQFVELVRE